MNEEHQEHVRSAVRAQYAAVAKGNSGCWEGGCGPGANASLALGYEPAELAAVPEGANMGLGCGNPGAIARLNAGEHVLDLGSGGGFDCFLAAERVGPEGRVIGVDMTPEMVSKARKNAAGRANIEFRLGEIEHLPIADSSIDAILSNCVINLSPDKAAVFRSAFRVLKPGGRLAISDVVATAEMPDSLLDDVKALTGCVAGAASAQDIHRMLEEAGFVDVNVRVNEESKRFIREWMPGSGIEAYVASATIEARKANPSCCEPR